MENRRLKVDISNFMDISHSPGSNRDGKHKIWLSFPGTGRGGKRRSRITAERFEDLPLSDRNHLLQQNKQESIYLALTWTSWDCTNETFTFPQTEKTTLLCIDSYTLKNNANSSLFIVKVLLLELPFQFYSVSYFAPCSSKDLRKKCFVSLCVRILTFEDILWWKKESSRRKPHPEKRQQVD